jgi:hypothetical protein
MQTKSQNNSEIMEMIARIREAREQTLSRLTDLTEADFPTPTEMERWTDVRRVLLRFGDHMREHANQAEHTRAIIERTPSMPQRMLQEAELAYGKLLAATIGLTDDDFNRTPPDGGWSLRQVLDHTLKSEENYLAVIAAALAKTKPGPHASTEEEAE